MLTAVFAATITATASPTSTALASTEGRISAKITDISESRKTFSASSPHSTPPRRRRWACRSCASSSDAGSGSAAKRQPQSGAGIRGRTTNQATAASPSTPSAQSTPNHG